jgi:hypothetical protein
MGLVQPFDIGSIAVPVDVLKIVIVSDLYLRVVIIGYFDMAHLRDPLLKLLCPLLFKVRCDGFVPRLLLFFYLVFEQILIGSFVVGR